MTRGQRAVVTAPGEVELQQFDLPPPAAGQALLRARRTLISPGTERAFFLDLPNTNAPYPLYPGYSFVGDVIACGAGVDSLQVGDRVATIARHGSHALDGRFALPARPRPVCPMTRRLASSCWQSPCKPCARRALNWASR